MISKSRIRLFAESPPTTYPALKSDSQVNFRLNPNLLKFFHKAVIIDLVHPSEIKAEVSKHKLVVPLLEQWLKSTPGTTSGSPVKLDRTHLNKQLQNLMDSFMTGMASCVPGAEPAGTTEPSSLLFWGDVTERYEDWSTSGDRKGDQGTR